MKNIKILLVNALLLASIGTTYGEQMATTNGGRLRKAVSNRADDSRLQVITLLNDLLADQYILYTKTYNYHWNIEGDMFNDLHDLFQKQFEALIVVVDDLAERVRALQGVSLGTLTEFLSRTRLKEEPGVVPSQFDMVARLLADYELVIEAMKNVADRCNDELSDRGTGQFLYDIVKQQEKTAWMLRSLLAKK